MARLHLKFRNIHAGARQAGETLFKSKPWQGTDEEKQSKFERFLSDASAVYGVPTPTLAVIPEGDVYGYVAPNTIILNKFSVISVFHSFRAHLQYMGAVDVPMYNARDAQAWACSLFYTLRPIQFRKMVRDRRINGVLPDDLLTNATLTARQEEVDEAFAGLIAESYSSEDINTLEDESEDIDDEFATDEEDEDEPMHDPGNGIAIPSAGAYRNPAIEVGASYTVAEAAGILGVSTSTVRNMTNDGRLASRRDGRRVLVTGESLSRIVPTSEVSE
jgi:excisionase family DNA binding protein